MSAEKAVTQNKATQNAMSKAEAVQMLIDGNERFVNEKFINRSFPEQIDLTSAGQAPFAAVLSCIDSRVPAEIIFDQGIGDIFSARVAGNVTGTNVLGSLEYAVKYAGSKAIVVLGHTSCGAVKGACDNLQDGNLTGLLAEILPAVEATLTVEGEKRDSKNIDFVNNVVLNNVHITIETMLKRSEIIREMYDDGHGEIEIVGAIYDVKTGKVKFL